jgi:hypothetical protein
MAVAEIQIFEKERPLKMDKNQEEEVYLCEYCSEECDEDEIIHFDDHCMCQNCYDELTIRCERCSETIWQNDSVSDENICLCRSCYESYYETCNECSRIVHQDDCNYEDSDEDSDEDHNTPLCENCFEKENHVIRNYSYKPSPIFYGNGLFLGVE